jgi:hypothetical protein
MERRSPRRQLKPGNWMCSVVLSKWGAGWAYLMYLYKNTTASCGEEHYEYPLPCDIQDEGCGYLQIAIPKLPLSKHQASTCSLSFLESNSAVLSPVFLSIWRKSWLLILSLIPIVVLTPLCRHKIWWFWTGVSIQKGVTGRKSPAKPILDRRLANAILPACFQRS